MNRRLALPLAALAAAACAALALLARPPAWTFVLPSGAAIQGWRFGWLRPAWPRATALAAAFSWAAWRVSARLPDGSRLSALRPLAWLTLVAAGMHAGAWIGATAAGLVLPFGTALVAAACVDRFFFRPARQEPSGAAGRRRARRMSAAAFAAAAVFLAAVWFGHARTTGWRGGGDAKHYIGQLENLLERGDLDLTDRTEGMMAARGLAADDPARKALLKKSHLRVNADGRIHSSHSFGYPLLAWPFVRLFGPPGEEWLRILLGALALAGCRAACLSFGASARAANAVSILLGTTCVWVYTALSFLPEMLGIGLCAWAVWALAAQGGPGRRDAVVATAVAAAACAYLPYAHIRFAPMALSLAGFFGLEGLFVRDEPFWRRKAPRLALFSLACLAAWLWLLRIHSDFFSGGGAYDYGNILLDRPIGMWAMLADRRGLVAVLPAAWALFAAPLRALPRSGADARRAALALATTAGILAACCSVVDAFDGTCLAGRYLFPAVPVLLPFLALSLDRTDRPGRLWILFLLVLPVLYFAFVSFGLSKNSLIASPEPLRRLSRLQPFWQPLPSFFFSGSAASRAAGSLFAGACLALSLLACGPSRRTRRPVLAAVLLAVAFFAGRAASLADPPSWADSATALAADRGIRSFRLLSGAPETLFDAFRDPADGAAGPLFAIAGDPVPAGVRRVHRPQDAPPNDESGRPLRWIPVRGRDVPAAGRPGWIAFRVRGRVEGGAARLAPVSGGRPAGAGETALGDGPFERVFRVRTVPGTGSNLRIALDGTDGRVFVDEFDFAPCPDGIEAILPLSANNDTEPSAP